MLLFIFLFSILFLEDLNSASILHIVFIVISLCGLLYTEKYIFDDDRVFYQIGIFPIIKTKVYNYSDIENIELSSYAENLQKKAYSFGKIFGSNLNCKAAIVLRNGDKVYFDMSSYKNKANLQANCKRIADYSGIKVNEIIE